MKSLTSLFIRLTGHQWKETVRSSYWQKSLLINILLTFVLIYLLINLILLGIFLGRILVSAMPDTDPVVAFSGIVLYYFLIDFIFRFLMQPSPTLSVVPYLHLPVRKTSLFHFVLIKSALSLFNFFPLVVFIPFTLKEVIPAYTAGFATTWIMALILFIFANNYLAFFFRKLFSVRSIVIFGVLIFAGLVIWLDISTERMVSKGFGNLLLWIAEHPSGIVIPALFLVFTYTLSWAYMYRQRYLEVKERAVRQYDSSVGSRYMTKKFGITGSLVSLELKLIMRNNRPRTFLVLSLFFMFYGFLVYNRHPFEANLAMLLLIGILLTGIMTAQYGQLVLSWESSYFDRLCTANITAQEMFTAKFWLFFLFNTFAFIITLPYAFYDFRILFINLASWVFNCGINIFIVLFLATYNTKKVDMQKGAFFNYEGVNAVQFLLVFPLILLPILIYYIFYLVASAWIGIAMTGLTGIIGLVFHRQLINVVARQFLSRKQVIINGFRNG